MSDIPSAVWNFDFCKISCLCIRLVMTVLLSDTCLLIPLLDSICIIDLNRIQFLHLFFPWFQKCFVFSDNFSCLDTFIVQLPHKRLVISCSNCCRSLFFWKTWCNYKSVLAVIWRVLIVNFLILRCPEIWIPKQSCLFHNRINRILQICLILCKLIMPPKILDCPCSPCRIPSVFLCICRRCHTKRIVLCMYGKSGMIFHCSFNSVHSLRSQASRLS